MKCKVCGKEFYGIGDTCASCAVKTAEGLIKNTTLGKVAAGLFAIANPYAALATYAASKTIQSFSEKEKEEEEAIEKQQMEAEQSERYDKICEEYDNLVEAENYEEALQVAIKASRNEGYVWFYYFAAQCADELEDFELVINLCDEGLPYCENGCELETRLFLMKYEAQDMLDMSRKEVRKNCLPVMLNATDDMLYYDENLKRYARNDFDEYDTEYAQAFLNQEYDERKLLVPVKQYTNLMQDDITVLDINKLSLTGIKFPVGHPRPYQLYIGHPSMPERYIPFDEYELEFLVDKTNDFCHLLISLGATEVKIECANNSTKENRSSMGLNVSGGLGKTGVASGEAAYHSDTKQRIEERIDSRIGLYQTNKPTSAPYVPNDMHWTDPVWEHIIRDRLYGNGHLNGTRTYTIETKSVRMLDKSELKSIKAEFESVYVSGKGAWSKEKDESFALSENSTLSIEVTFASFEELVNGDTQITAQTTTNNNSLTSNELEYIEAVKTCLTEDATISPSERRLLDRLRSQLGISEPRAKGLEDSLAPQFTDDEKDYLEEYKVCLEESDGQLSVSERRLLDRLRTKLGIAEDRAKELENLIYR